MPEDNKNKTPDHTGNIPLTNNNNNGNIQSRNIQQNSSATLLNLCLVEKLYD